MMAVAVRFGLEWPMPAVVKEFDDRMVPTEAGLLFTNRHPDWRNRCDPIAGLPVVCMSPHSAELFFLDRYESLTGRRS